MRPRSTFTHPPLFLPDDQRHHGDAAQPRSAELSRSHRLRLRVFLAEDDVEMRRMVAGALRHDGHLVLEADTGDGLLIDVTRAFLNPNPSSVASVVISDVRMPGRDGLSVLRELRVHDWCPPVIMITAFGDSEIHEEARRLGAVAVLDKPFDLADLRIELARLGDGAQRIARSAPRG
jgi:DNA-binding response OmpR family regulator